MAVKRKQPTPKKAAAKPATPKKAAPKAEPPNGDAKPPAAKKQKDTTVMRPFPVRAKGDKAILIVTACSTDGKTYTAHARDGEGTELQVPVADCARV